MFLNVLEIIRWKVDAALEKSTLGIAKEIVKPHNPTPSRGFAWSSADLDFLADFFRDIPNAPPGHYCRKYSSKMYLDVIISTMEKLHSIYKARCNAFGKQAFLSYKFTEYFKANRIIHCFNRVKKG